jgi:hypothetical protein
VKLTVEMDDEVADEFFRERLKDDYFMLCSEIKYLKGKKKLEPYQQEDQDNCYDTVLALETLFNYYFIEEEAKQLKSEGLAVRTLS